MIEGPFFGTVIAVHVWLDTPADLTSLSSPAAAFKQDRIATVTFGLSFSLLCGLSFGCCFAFTGVNIGGPDLGPVAGVTFGLSLVFTGAIAGMVIGWLTAGRIGSAAYGIATATSFGCVFPPARSTVYGLVVGGILGFLLGVMIVLPKAWGCFVFGRTFLAFSFRMPWRLMPFLSDAHRRGALRQVGAVYQFRHAVLQDYLAEHPGGPPLSAKKGRHRYRRSIKP
jgi:hypothetical protein